MDFRREAREGANTHTLEAVASGFALIVAFVSFLLLPVIAQGVVGAFWPAWSPLAMTAALLASLGVYPLTRTAARTVLLHHRDVPVVEAATKPRTLPGVLPVLGWLLWLALVFGIAWWLRRPLRAAFGSNVDLFFQIGVFAPWVARPLYQARHSSWRRLVTLAELVGAICIGVGAGSLLANQLDTWIASTPQSTPLVLPLTVVLLPAGLMVALLPTLTIQNRRALVPAGRGDFDRAIPWALATPGQGAPLAALLQVEAGRIDEARTTLQGIDGPQTPATQLVGAILCDEEGDPEGAWERMQALWKEHKTPPDVLMAAHGLHLGADVRTMLEEMEAVRPRLDPWLAGIPLQPGFDACRAWVLAVEGDEAAARAVLPTVTTLPPLYQIELDYLVGRTLHALGDPRSTQVLTRAAAGPGRAGRLAARFLASLPSDAG